MRVSLRDVPTRVATGAYVLHSGWGKWTDDSAATGVHGMAAGAFPFLKPIPPTTFLTGLAAAEIGLGAALLAPFVPNRLAGAGLTAFAGSLLTMYLRTRPCTSRAASGPPRPAPASARTCGCSASPGPPRRSPFGASQPIAAG
jgi:hypothetical protein